MVPPHSQKSHFREGGRERVPGLRLQKTPEETDYQDPDQSGFKPGFSTEMTLVTLVHDLTSLLVPLALSRAPDAGGPGVLLNQLWGLRLGCSVAFLLISPWLPSVGGVGQVVSDHAPGSLLRL